jgi:hypothetical protein
LKPQILCISESWFNSFHIDSEFNLNGYEIFRYDRTNQLKKGGGVALYCKKNSNFKSELFELSFRNDDIDYLCIKVQQTNTHAFYITVIYCPPDKTSIFKENFEEIFSEIIEKDIIILGDCNIDYLDKQENWSQSIQNCGLTQIITNPTRMTSDSAKLLDHIYVNQVQNISNSGILRFSVSDHQPIFVVRKLRYTEKRHNVNHITIKYRLEKH